jgi:hypothetical protein
VLVEKGNAGARLCRRFDEAPVVVRRQTGFQGAVAGRADIQPVALDAVGRRDIAFEQPNVDTASVQAVRKAQATGSGADDEDFQGTGRGEGHDERLLFTPFSSVGTLCGF